jgi:hypothetical protein
VQLACIFSLYASKGLASNAQFLLLTLKLLSAHTDGSFIAHVFTSCRWVADVVPPEKQKVNAAKRERQNERLSALPVSET